MSKHFETAAKAAASIEKKITGFWQELVLSVAELTGALAEDGKTVDESAIPKGEAGQKAVAKLFTQQEALFKASTKKNLNDIGAYRSAKSVIMSALRGDVTLFEDDKPRGKTAIEKDIKESRTEKATADKIKGALDTINKMLDSEKNDMVKGEYAVVGGLVRDLTVKLSGLMAEAPEAR